MDNNITFIHTVFFWFKEGTTQADRAKFEQGMTQLGTCPTIESFRFGKPAGTPRAVVDNSYTYAWIVHFKTGADQDAYQVDPIHKEFIDLYQHLWERVQVYDTVLG